MENIVHDVLAFCRNAFEHDAITLACDASETMDILDVARPKCITALQHYSTAVFKEMKH